MSIGDAIALATERIVKPVEGMHRAIARPWFRALGPLGRPVRFTHDVISGIVYASIRGAATAGAEVASLFSADTAAGDTSRAVVNGLWGDALGRYASRVGTEMGIRSREGELLQIGPTLRAAYPDAAPRVIVLVHGLVETERCWGGGDDRPGLLEGLDLHPSVTPLLVRYNTGLSVATSGAQLAALLEDARRQWPVPVASMALVGHSMGGLVVLEACAAARRAGHDWLGSVTDVVTIGSPHRGAPLENLTRVAVRVLAATPQTRALADFLDTRSSGIKDLGSGMPGIATEHEPEAAGAGPIETHVVAGVITPNTRNPVGALVGDLMVRPSSATPRSPEPTNVVVVGGVHHFDLLHDPAALRQILHWLVPALE